MKMGLQKQGFFLWLLAFLNTLILSMGDVHYYDFTLKESNFRKLCTWKSMLTVNGSFPGPEIQVQRGDTVFVNVHNQAKYGVSIRWHGVKQSRNLNRTQRPIQPGRNFTYQVKLSDEVGTIWWHAQSHRLDTIVPGAIVILPSASETYPFHPPEADQTIILASWFKGDAKEINETGSPNMNVSGAYTINGSPGNRYGCPNDTTYSLQVDYGNTYLLRIINAVMDKGMFFGITKHSLMVVGYSGKYVEQFSSDYILLAPGETMDVLVAAYENMGQYHMATRPFVGASARAFGNDDIMATAILQYTNSGDDFVDLSLPPLPNANDSVAARNFYGRIKSLNSTEKP